MEPVPFLTGKDFADVVAELAFEIVSIQWQSQGEIKTQKIGVDDFDLARIRLAKRLTRANAVQRVYWLTSLDRIPQEVTNLVKVYSVFFSEFYRAGDLTFRPKLKGAGILRTVEGDVSSSSSLIEVKTVNRNLTSHDFRQMIVYLGLGLWSREYAWREAVFFNPRRATFFTFDVENVISYLSARSAPEAFEQLIRFLSEPEVVSGLL